MFARTVKSVIAAILRGLCGSGSSMVGLPLFLLGGVNGYVVFATRNSALVERYHKIEPFHIVIYTSHAVFSP